VVDLVKKYDNLKKTLQKEEINLLWEKEKIKIDNIDDIRKTIFQSKTKKTENIGNNVKKVNI
jgi:hypothetical protein